MSKLQNFISSDHAHPLTKPILRIAKLVEFVPSNYANLLHDFSNICPLLWVGMLVTVAGVVTVAMNTPHGHAPAKAKAGAVETAVGGDPPAAMDAASSESPGTDEESVG